MTRTNIRKVVSIENLIRSNIRLWEKEGLIPPLEELLKHSPCKRKKEKVIQ